MVGSCKTCGAENCNTQLQAENTVLRAELEALEDERNALLKDLRECCIDSGVECKYCLYKTAPSFCCDCTDGSRWKYLKGGRQ